jgi:hypothetical protein
MLRDKSLHSQKAKARKIIIHITGRLFIRSCIQSLHQSSMHITITKLSNQFLPNKNSEIISDRDTMTCIAALRVLNVVILEREIFENNATTHNKNHKIIKYLEQTKLKKCVVSGIDCAPFLLHLKAF